MFFYKEVGFLVFGSRLKRIGEKFIQEVSNVYKEEDIAFETVWFPFFYLLDKHPEISLSEIAIKLEMSHSACSQMVSQIQKRGLMITKCSSVDARKKIISLTSEGKQLLVQVKPIWESIELSIETNILTKKEKIIFNDLLNKVESQIMSNDVSNYAIDLLHSKKLRPNITQSTINNDIKTFCDINKCEIVSSDSSFICASINNAMVGILEYNISSSKSTNLDNIIIAKQFRRVGLATKLINHLVNENNVTQLVLNKRSKELIQLLLNTNYKFTVQ